MSIAKEYIEGFVRHLINLFLCSLSVGLDLTAGAFPKNVTQSVATPPALLILIFADGLLLGVRH